MTLINLKWYLIHQFKGVVLLHSTLLIKWVMRFVGIYGRKIWIKIFLISLTYCTHIYHVSFHFSFYLSSISICIEFWSVNQIFIIQHRDLKFFQVSYTRCQVSSVVNRIWVLIMTSFCQNSFAEISQDHLYFWMCWYDCCFS